MGWLIVFFWKDIVPYIPPSGLINWIIAAGLTYSIGGVIFYASKRLPPHYHAIWHLFCIGGGSALFYVGYMITIV